MDNQTLAIALVAILCIFVIFIMANNSGKKSMHGRPKQSQLSYSAADGLNPDLVVYLRSGCGYCDKQKKELEHTPFNYVACGPVDNIPSTGTPVTPPIDCGAITGFPTWYNTATKSIMPGFKTLDQLHKL
jgi:hypothetical protein